MNLKKNNILFLVIILISVSCNEEYRVLTYQETSKESVYDEAIKYLVFNKEKVTAGTSFSDISYDNLSINKYISRVKGLDFFSSDFDSQIREEIFGSKYMSDNIQVRDIWEFKQRSTIILNNLSLKTVNKKPGYKIFFSEFYNNMLIAEIYKFRVNSNYNEGISLNIFFLFDKNLKIDTTVVKAYNIF